MTKIARDKTKTVVFDPESTDWMWTPSREIRIGFNFRLKTTLSLSTVENQKSRNKIFTDVRTCEGMFLRADPPADWCTTIFAENENSVPVKNNDKI